MICGCNGHISKSDNSTPVEYVTKLVEKGCSQKAAEIVDTFSNETKEYLLENYNEKIEQLVLLGFNEEQVKGFLLTNLDYDTYVYSLQNNIIGDKLVSLTNFNSDKFFILKNIDLYYKYEKDFNDNRQLIEYVNTKAYKKPFEESENSDTSKGILMIASKIYYLNDYVPNNLVDIESEYCINNNQKLIKEAYDAYKEMVVSARNENIDFYISTAYRSFEFQSTLYNNYLKNDPQEVVDSYSSRPGYSDHQIGLSCDIRTKDKTFSDFTDTLEAKWLKDNAYKYGFIMRYPEGKDNITGYISESWHYRYVGKTAAKIIYDNNITFDEYYAYYVE